MKIQDQQFITEDKSRVDLKASVIHILKNLPSPSGIDGARIQVDLAKRLEAGGKEMDLTPEDAVLIRSLINRSQHLPPTVQIPMYDAFDLKE